MGRGFGDDRHASSSCSSPVGSGSEMGENNVIASAMVDGDCGAFAGACNVSTLGFDLELNDAGCSLDPPGVKDTDNPTNLSSSPRAGPSPLITQLNPFATMDSPSIPSSSAPESAGAHS